jgi:hypothetical protein
MVAKHLQDLVITQMPSGVNDASVQRYVQYFMRILSSRIQSTAGPADADHIKTLLMNKIALKSQGAPQNSHKGLSVHQETVRFEELYARLLRSKQLNKKTQMLHVMLELAGNGVPPSERGNAAQKQGTVLQSVFQSKLAN